MKLGQLDNLLFVNAVQDIQKKELPASSAFKILKIINAIEEEGKLYEQRKKQIIDKYKNGSDKFTQEEYELLSEDKRNELDKELSELAEVDVDLKEKPIIIDENVTIKPAYLFILAENNIIKLDDKLKNGVSN